VTGQAPPCLRCRRTVLWAKTERGKWLPLDPEPDPKGNQAAWQDSDGTRKTRQLSPKSDPPWGWERVYMPHLLTTTCKPQAAAVPARPLPANIVPITAAPSRRGGPKRR
jgi:hypothetical protein